MFHWRAEKEKKEQQHTHTHRHIFMGQELRASFGQSLCCVQPLEWFHLRVAGCGVDGAVSSSGGADLSTRRARVSSQAFGTACQPLRGKEKSALTGFLQRTQIG